MCSALHGLNAHCTFMGTASACTAEFNMKVGAVHCVLYVKCTNKGGNDTISDSRQSQNGLAVSIACQWPCSIWKLYFKVSISECANCIQNATKKTDRATHARLVRKSQNGQKNRSSRKIKGLQNVLYGSLWDPIVYI